jgi:Tfp pilus assembly protein PilO
MAKRNLLLLILLVVLTATFWAGNTLLIDDKPNRLLDLEDELEELNEQLISAQILANKLARVYTLFDENLALSVQDSLAEDASMPFLNSLTEMLEDLNITLLSIKPKNRITLGNALNSPYELIIRCSYDQLGQFMAEMERSPRLITVDEFVVKNGIERIKNITDEQQLAEQVVELHISTMTLVKSKAKVVS